MDKASFDRIARLLGGASSRRAGLGAAAAALFGAAAPAAARPGGSSQCGQRKNSACRKTSECCSGVCDLSRGKENRDGLGRCRCARRTEKCKSDKDCCNRKNQGLVCLGGVCSPPCTALGRECSSSTNACCAGICGGVASEDRGFIATTCCLPLNASGCSADNHCCGGADGITACQQGVCVNACKELQQACDANTDNCCAGACSPYTWPANPQTRGGSQGGITSCCVAQGQTGCTTERDCCFSNNGCDGGLCRTLG
ncbi:MAG: hypothetical protein ACKOWF_01870 [Chloroflexota bacterium]